MRTMMRYFTLLVVLILVFSLSLALKFFLLNIGGKVKIKKEITNWYKLQRNISSTQQKHSLKKEIDVENQNQKRNFDNVMNYDVQYTPHITKELYISGYMINNSDACNDKSENVMVTILVISAPGHFVEREAIRTSWGEIKERKEVVFSFIVGLSDNNTLDKAVIEESNKNGDLIVNNIEDLYQNLSLKTLSAFVWFKKFCHNSKFLLKVDDDVFVHLNKLLELIQVLLKTNTRQRSITGHIVKNWKPVRNQKSKYRITEAEHPGDAYPDFATGPSYLVSQQAVEEIIPVAMEHRYIHLEDVFLTGIVADILGIARVNNQQFEKYATKKVPIKKMGCMLKYTITVHWVHPQDQKKLQKLALNQYCN